jgi:hypothetical protein
MLVSIFCRISVTFMKIFTKISKLFLFRKITILSLFSRKFYEYFVKNVRFLKLGKCLRIQIFSEYLCKNKYFCGNLPKSHVIKYTSFTKIVSLLHMLATSFALFVINVRKSQHVLIVSKIFVSTLPPPPTHPGLKYQPHANPPPLSIHDVNSPGNFLINRC